VRRLGRGHIHQTFVARYRGDDGAALELVHQRVNTAVFADVDTLAANLQRVTAHLGGPLRLVPAVGGGALARDDQGALWRTLTYVAGARTHHRFADPAQAAAGAAAAARLVGDLADLPGPPLREVIPGFHDVEGRLADLARAASEDPAGRARDCRAALDAALGHAAVAAEVAAARHDGRLPERTVHNDAKVDNVAFDERSGAAVCLVDLDTVGPGTVLFDVGDLVRSGAPTGPEDGDPARTGVRADIVDAVLGAYADAGAAWLTGPEVDLLPLAGPLMALEAAARFLTDHLRGDVYFAVDGPGHNLRRARNQLRVLELLT
jgi:aminoglycoside phosphotransferase (APT) family kinase protein